MKIELGYGKGLLSLEVAESNLGVVMHPKMGTVEKDETTILLDSLKHPVGSPPLDQIVKPRERVAIVTSDITRPMPSYKVLPTLLDLLGTLGIKDEDIIIVFGLGNHRKQTAEEMKKIVSPEVFGRIRCIDSSQDDVVHLGDTPMGTPVDLFRPVVEADRVICLGNIDYHYFAGYSGGYKAIMPGISTEAAIQMNHRHMVKAAAAAGKIEGNPVREDIESVAAYLKVDFIINVVLDEHKNILGSFAGDPIAAHRAGCRLLDASYLSPIPEKAEIVLVSSGGYPKDINLYQAQKALDNAKYAVKDGGIVILTAACTEGLGEATFEQWMTGAEKPADMVRDIEANFVLGGHKAAAIGLLLEKCKIYLVSDMEDDFVRSIFMEPFDTVEAALGAAFEELGKDAAVHVMPVGGSTLPQVRETE